MSQASKRLKEILYRNRARLGLVKERNSSDSSSSENESSDSEEKTRYDSNPKQKELVDLFDNLILENSSHTSKEVESSNNNNFKMENIRFHTSLLPTFSGKQEHLESFILAIDEFYALYYGNSEAQKQLVTAAIKSKLVDDARNFYLSRPDLNDWLAIRVALRQKFGDPVTYLVLMQQMQYIKINRNESMLEFVDRLKTFVQRIIAKIQCEVTDVTSKTTLLSQVENTSVLLLTANSPQTLKTMLMIQRPNTLDTALQHVINYNMIESQVNFTNNHSPMRNHMEKPHQSLNHNNRGFNNNFINPHTNQHNTNQIRPQVFPSQPINVQPRFVPRHYPTNAQVFGKSRQIPQQNRPRQDTPTPMSISTAGPSRFLHQQKQPPMRHNTFIPTGPRNFISQELTNVEVNSQTPLYDDSFMYNQYDENYLQQQNNVPPQNDFEQNLAFQNYCDTNYEACQETEEINNENFQKVASEIPLT